MICWGTAVANFSNAYYNYKCAACNNIFEYENYKPITNYSPDLEPLSD